MKPQQVQKLLANQSKVLLQVSEQGLPRGDFTKISFWLQYLDSDAIFEKMISLFTEAFAQDNDIDVILVLGAIKTGLYSPNEQTAKLCLQLLLRVLETLREASKPLEQAHFDSRFSKWFTKIVLQTRDSFLHNSILQSSLDCLEMHDNLVQDVARLIFSVFQSDQFNLSQLPEMIKVAYSDDVFMLYESMHVILCDMNKIDCDEVKLALEGSTLIQDALVEATDDNGDVSLRLKCTNLLLEIWFLHPSIPANPDKQHYGIGSLSLKDSFHYVLEQGVTMRDRIFSLNVYAVGLALAERLASKANSETQAVYRTLAGGLLSHY